MCVCLFSIEIQTAGRIGTKFGTEVVLEGGKVLGGFWPVPPLPTPPGMGCIKGVWGASGASTMRFDENFIKQMLQGNPDLVGGSPIRVPNPDPEGPGPHVLLEPWSLTMKGSS